VAVLLPVLPPEHAVAISARLEKRRKKTFFIVLRGFGVSYIAQRY